MQGNPVSTFQRGVTLIEACITLAIVSILVGTAAPSMREAQVKRVLEGTAGELAIDLHYVRSEAVTRNDGVRISFYGGIGGRCYLVHTGDRSDCSCNGSGPPQCTNGAVVLKSAYQPADYPVQLVANVNSMLFNAINGTTVPGGTVCVIAPSGREIRHVVNIMGRVRSCVPTNSIGACQPC